jgi:hypothetical protein
MACVHDQVDATARPSGSATALALEQLQTLVNMGRERRRCAWAPLQVRARFSVAHAHRLGAAVCARGGPRQRWQARARAALCVASLACMRMCAGSTCDARLSSRRRFIAQFIAHWHLKGAVLTDGTFTELTARRWRGKQPRHRRMKRSSAHADAVDKDQSCSHAALDTGEVSSPGA